MRSLIEILVFQIPRFIVNHELSYDSLHCQNGLYALNRKNLDLWERKKLASGNKTII